MAVSSLPRPRLPWQRRWLYRLLVLLGLYGVLELTSCCVYRCLEGKAFSFSHFQRQRQHMTHHEDVPLRESPSADFVPHPYLGYVLNPNFENNHVRIPGRCGGLVSEYGFCDNRPPVLKRSPGKVIVGIVGGSLASFWTVEAARKLEKLLAQSPRFRGKQFEYVNLAVVAYKQPQPLIAVNYALALGAEFDILLSIDGFNEVAMYALENQQAGLFPMFPRFWPYLVATMPDPEIRRMAGKIAYLEDTRTQWATLFHRAPLSWSVTANLIWQLRDRRLTDEVARTSAALGEYQPRLLPYCAVGPSRTWSSEAELYQEMVAVWQRCSLQLAAICKANGIAYYHFLQPNQYVPGSKPLGAEERKRAWEDNQCNKTSVEQGYPLLRRAGTELRRAGISFHDLTMIFRDHPEPIYIDTCCHVNVHGNELLTEAIAAAILETPEPPAATAQRDRP
jgi:hypothetical protein